MLIYILGGKGFFGKAISQKLNKINRDKINYSIEKTVDYYLNNS